MPINVSNDYSSLVGLIHHRVRQDDDAGNDTSTSLETPRNDTPSKGQDIGHPVWRQDISAAQAAITGKRAVDPGWLFKSGLHIVTNAITPVPRVMKEAEIMFARIAASNRQNSPSNAQLANTCKERSGSVAESGDALAGDLGVDPTSIVGARVVAIRKLLRVCPTDHEDEHMLDLANQVHNQAAAHPLDKEAEFVSMALWREESLAWARANGEENVVAEEARLHAYRELWSLALHPPSLPVFKSRSVLAREYGVRNTQFLSKIRLPVWGSQPLSDGTMVEQYKNHSEVLAEYYAQFHRYIELDLDRVCTATALAKGLEAGFGRLFLEHKPQQVWVINDVVQSISSAPLMMAASVRRRTVHRGGAFIFRMHDHSYGFIGPNGVFKRLKGTVDAGAGKLRKSAILDAYDLRCNAAAGDGQRRCGAAGRVSAASDYDIEFGEPQGTPSPLSIKAMFEAQARKHALLAIRSWKNDNYDASALETVIKAVIPFYEVFQKIRYDPDYRLKVGDIVLDLIELSLMVLTLGVAAVGGAKGIRIAVGAARAVKGRGAGAVASNALKSMLDGFKTSTFLLQSGKELIDFVLPVFSAKKLLQVMPHASFDVAAILKTTLQRSHADLAAVRPGKMLDSLYRSLSKTESLGANVSPEAVMKFMDTAANRPVPDRLFRGQGHVGASTKLRVFTAHAGASRDDYLVACVKHSARTGGSEGGALSLSADRAVAARFSKAHKESRIFTVNTLKDRDNFRPIEHILKYDGPRLVKEGKITAGTLRAAIKNAFIQGESEIFYVLGSIPDDFIEAVH